MPDGPEGENRTGVWYNANHTVAIFADSLAVYQDGSVGGGPIGDKGASGTKGRVPVNYQWKFLFQATEKVNASGWKQNALVADMAYSVTIQLPALPANNSYNLTYEQVKAKNGTGGFNVSADPIGEAKIVKKP